MDSKESKLYVQKRKKNKRHQKMNMIKTRLQEIAAD